MISIQKRGKVYQYRFEAARVNGKRKQITKSGFKTKNAALLQGKKLMKIINMVVVRWKDICLMGII